MMTTATKITLVRVILIPAFMACFLLSRQTHWLTYPALALFVIASVSDYFDGYVARKYNQVTDFGKFLDPLVDKLLVVSAMCILCQWGEFPAWALMLVLTREFAVTGLRLVAAAKGTVLAAAWSGKVKTACTMVGLAILIVFHEGFAFSAVLNWIVIGVIVVTTLYSGVSYFVRNTKVFRNDT